ncbi:MAG: YncE family protein [Firmicutes bacterium]|jgi:YVTN family beta-propeller protein|nr:YncE family protein [Bacillota bacterium]
MDEVLDDVEVQQLGSLGCGTAYVTNREDASVSVIDLNRAQEVTRIPVGTRPQAIAASPDKRFVYVTNFNDATLSVINTLTNTVVDTVGLNVGAFAAEGPTGVAVTPDGRFVYVANIQSDNLSVVDARRLAVVTTVPMSAPPADLRITADGNLAYVTMGVGAIGFIGVVDLNTNLQVKAISICSNRTGIDIAPRMPLAYQACTFPVGRLHAVNTDLAEPSAESIITNLPPDQIAFNPEGTLAYVTQLDGSRLWVVDVFRHAVRLTIPVGGGSSGVKVSDNGLLVVVANLDDNTVSIVDARTNTVAATVPVGSSPFRVAIV